MLNFRKLKQDYSPALLKQGRELFEEGIVVSAKIVSLTPQDVHITASAVGNFQNTYTCEMEINLSDSTTTDADCDCLHKYDCQHLAALIFYLEEHYDEMVVAYSKETDLEQEATIDEETRETLLETIKESETKEVARQDRKYQKELLQEYIDASQTLGKSPFFLSEEEISCDRAELALIFNQVGNSPLSETSDFEIQLALRLPFRSKPLYVHNIREFLHAIRDGEALYLANKRYFFSFDSFDAQSNLLLQILLNSARFPENKQDKGNEKNLRSALVDAEAFGMLLARIYDAAAEQSDMRGKPSHERHHEMPSLYRTSLEEPLRLANQRIQLQFNLEYLEAPAPKVLINPAILLDYETSIPLESVLLFTCAKPGFIYEETYYRFPDEIKKKHLQNLEQLRRITIPEPLFGTFIENSLPQLMNYAKVSNREAIERFVTLPYIDEVKAECDILFLNGELEATLHFLYGEIRVPAAPSKLNIDTILPFVTPEGILARNLTEEQKILEDLFQDFFYDASQGHYIAKHDKKIVEFMTEVVPRYQDRVTFHCPENLLEQFIYDNTEFRIHLRETERIDQYLVELTVDGHLSGVSVDQLWECLSSKRSYIELMPKKTGRRRRGEAAEPAQLQKILVLDLEKLRPLVQIFDEIGIQSLGTHAEARPLWSLASIDPEHFKNLPVKFSMSKRLKEIQQQMLGQKAMKPSPIPESVNAILREYQIEGVHWLERLRTMHLNGILADDMGLGKTLQAIIAITQFKYLHPDALSLIVCPTSLVYNWKEEFHKFNADLRVLPVDGTPLQRKKLLEESGQFDVIITSYSLLQKDIEHYKQLAFGYVILDEAQHIKNRGTRNAKSVKMIQAAHRLILTGTPVENCLDELWSLFDFLMPGLLSSYDRFVEKYIRNPTRTIGDNLETLRTKVSPFILRRMKRDVVSELPPISEIVYHCHLSDTQRDLYRSYAESAREELSQLVKREGFDRVQIHVLATLTRLKQICCHPAIFAKERAERGDSSKYEMLMELMHTLIEGRHKAVIFSQYTRMLTIMREDFQKMGVRFEYLDGASKNRLDIVKRFNEDSSIPVFLVSLKAGGVGLNLVGADTVIHYDMWWNPAVESQATDRVHRIGQTQSVSTYKLVTLNTIEEKILELQNRKKGLVKKIVSFEDEVIAKLTWEEVLELLQA